MNNQSDNQSEPLWRNQLSEAQRADLRGKPELELEARLTHALSDMRDVCVPSNFTARVLDAIQLEENRQGRPQGWQWNWRALWPRLAVATAVLIVAGVSIQRYEAKYHQAHLIKNLVEVAQTDAPSMDTLADLDAIQRMSQSGRADGELLAALQ
jgi:hypothetical protein